MKVSPIKRGHLMAAAVILAGAALVMGVLSPAASDEVRPFLQALGIISCTSSGPCQEGKNSGTGPGLEGISAQGKGAIGQTTFNSTSSSNGQAGMLGQDASTSGAFDVGVEGTAKNGIGVEGVSNSNSGVIGSSSSGTGVLGTASASHYGVIGRAGKASKISFVLTAGVWGDSTLANGVVGTSVDQAGVVAESTNGVGLSAVSTNVDAVQGGTQQKSTLSGMGRSGVHGFDASTDGGTLNAGVTGTSSLGTGVAGTSTNGVGVEGFSSNFVGVNAVGGEDLPADHYPALSVVGTSRDLIEACPTGTANPCDANSEVFEVRYNGDVFIAGQIYTAGSCEFGCVAGHRTGEKRVRFYTPRESLPTVEDLGEAQLVSGRAYVRIDPAFANTMDIRAAYMVFITPKGDSRGLYVTDESATGFAVRESQGGRSTLAFDYRIVAKPFGEHPARLQMIAVSKPGTSVSVSRIR